MRTPAEVADLIERMVTARLDGESTQLITLLDALMCSPRGDVMNVAALLAGILAEDLRDVTPELGYHTVSVSHVTADGDEVEDSVDALPPEVATFAQMITAVANSDRVMARDLFLGYCGEDWRRALALIIFGLNEVVHANAPCPTCDGGGDPSGNTVLEGAVE